MHSSMRWRYTASIMSGWPPSAAVRSRTAAHDGLDAALVAHLGRIGLDARGLLHVAHARDQQRHQHIVQRIHIAAHIQHVGAVLHQVDGLLGAVRAHSSPSSTSSAARISARALCSVSFHSISGTESATTPAAACT